MARKTEKQEERKCYLVVVFVQARMRASTEFAMREKQTTHVRSHSHDSSFLHSNVSLFYSYTVVAETHFVIVTAPLVSLFMPWWGGGLEP
jgi:hypothetical protein